MEALFANPAPKILINCARVSYEVRTPVGQKKLLSRDKRKSFRRVRRDAYIILFKQPSH
jgi:hypothetical protein